MPIAKLSVDFEARFGQFENELKRMTKIADGVSSQFAGALKGVGLAMAGLGAGLGLDALKGRFDEVIGFAARLDDMAEATGATVENLSALSSVAKIGGHDLGLVETSLQKLSKALHSTDEETKGAGKAIAAIGLSIDELRSKDPAEAMLDIAKALDGFKDSGGKTAAAIAILGKNGAALLPFLKDLAEKSELVGKVTAEQAAQAELYQKNLVKISASASEASKALALEMLPALTKMTSEMAEGINAAGGFWAAMSAGATINPFKSTAENLKAVRADIEKMEADQKEYGYFDEQKYARKTAQLKMLKAAQLREALGDNPEANMDANDRKFAQKKSLDDLITGNQPSDKSKKTGAAKADDYTRIIQSLNERIAVETAALSSTEKLNQAQSEYAKYQSDIASGAVKLTGAQKSVVGAYYQVYLARAKEREFADLVDKQTEAVRQQNIAMMDRVRAIDRETEMYGKTESEISLLEQARLRDAIATAAENGAGEDLLETLRNELQLRENITDALVRKDQRKTEFDAHVEAMKKSLDDMSEFSKQAAKNMQDAFADFLFDPFAKGANDMLKSFGQTVQKMIAQAASAQILKTLLGDMGSTGKVGGLIGDLFGSFFKGGVSNLAAPGTSALGPTMGMAAINLPSFAVGTDFVPHDMVAQIHKGERIVPAAQNKPGMTGVGSMHVTQNFYGAAEPAQQKRAAASAYRSMAGMMAQSGRY